ncbi:MAG TPA: penicillin-binding protein 2 [Gemmatimonadaceae bacterium]|nr:penicillin-binding protein 2 [Gemmatimonadaceae bacterium]
MSYHPNEIARRARQATWILGGVFLVLVGAFFRTQVVQNRVYTLQSEENRLREVPLPAPRGIIYDRHNQVIAENVPGYSVSILSPSADSLRASLQRLSMIIQLSPEQIDLSVRRYRRAPNRPTVVLPDASFDVVSVLEERRIEFPGLIIQSAPKRYYPDGAAVASFVGYVGEITEAELSSSKYQGYKAGQVVGKGGLERQYEDRLRGREGVRFVEVDARGRVVREAGARQDLRPEAADPLYTNIDLDLQRSVATLFGDSLQGGAIAIDPQSGGVLALYSAPSYDPNRFIGGISSELWKQLNNDPRRPLFNKVTQGRYPPGSTWKLATATVALEQGLVALDDHMPIPCTGGYQFGNRYFHCWDKKGHGSVSLQRAIEVSCDVYFYQLGLKVGLSRLVAGGIALGARDRSGIDLPDEARPIFPTADVEDYYDRRYGKRNWSQAVVLNLAIGQGENDQTVANMGRFYTALATDGTAATPEIVRRRPERARIFQLSQEQLEHVRAALAGVVSRGTASSAQIQGVVLAGKTGTAQNAQDLLHNHAWFVGFAPARDPQIVVAVMLEFGGHGDRAARIASKIIARYLKAVPTQLINTDG